MEKKIDLIFPNVDEELEIFAREAKNLGAKIVISPIESVRLCQDKAYLMDYLKNVVPIPKSCSDGDVFPLLVKPTVSRGSRNIYKANNKRELEFFVYFIRNQGLTPMIQEYLPGRILCLDCLYVDGTCDVVVYSLLLLFIGEIINYR